MLEQSERFFASLYSSDGTEESSHPLLSHW